MQPRRTVPLFAAFALIVAAACSGGSSSKTATRDVSTTPTDISSNPAPLREDGGLSAVEIVKKLAPSVVRVQTEGATIDVFGRAAPGGGVGSGIVLDSEGHIVTNNHVVTLGSGTPAQNITVTLNDQRTAPATIVGRDEPTD